MLSFSACGQRADVESRVARREQGQSRATPRPPACPPGRPRLGPRLCPRLCTCLRLRPAPLLCAGRLGAAHRAAPPAWHGCARARARGWAAHRQGAVRGHAVARDDGLRVDLRIDEALGALEQLARKHAHLRAGHGGFNGENRALPGGGTASRDTAVRRARPRRGREATAAPGERRCSLDTPAPPLSQARAPAASVSPARALAAAAAGRRTEVVPSPTSSSCTLEMSTSTLAAGLSIMMDFRIVAPSFVIFTTPPPMGCRILSMPLGPSVVLTRSQMANAPMKEAMRAFSPFSCCAPSPSTLAPTLPKGGLVRCDHARGVPQQRYGAPGHDRPHLAPQFAHH